jgi:hypothetical protein
LDSIPWLVESGIFPKASQWLALDDPIILQDNLPEWYLINEVQERFLEPIVFRTLGDSNRLGQFFLGLVQVLRRKMAKARVIFKDVGSKMCEFNPPYLLPKGQFFWVFEGGKILELHLDPKEWRWRKRGSLFESNLFGYTTKRGYREIIN